MKVRTKADKRRELAHRAWVQFDKEMHNSDITKVGPFTTAYIVALVSLALIVIGMMNG